MKLLIKANGVYERCSDIAIARDETTGRLFVIISISPNIFDLAPVEDFGGYDLSNRKLKPDNWFEENLLIAAQALIDGHADLIQGWPQEALRAGSLRFLGRDFSVLGPEYILKAGQAPRLVTPEG
jgi:hypothetical protein